MLMELQSGSPNLFDRLIVHYFGRRLELMMKWFISKYFSLQMRLLHTGRNIFKRYCSIFINFILIGLFQEVMMVDLFMNIVNLVI